MVADLCNSCFRPATPLSEKSKINKLKWRGARSENTLISEGTGRSLINKTSSRGVAERALKIKRHGRGTKTQIQIKKRKKESTRLLGCIQYSTWNGKILPYFMIVFIWIIYYLVRFNTRNHFQWEDLQWKYTRIYFPFSFFGESCFLILRISTNITQFFILNSWIK
jgi:hypothetical protein